MSLPQLDVPSAFRWTEVGGIPLLAADLGSARIAFTTRLGGMSKPPFDTLNLGILGEDDRNDVDRNQELVLAALERPRAGAALARQVHGTTIEVHDAPPAGRLGAEAPELPEADGQLVRDRSSTAIVLAADCLPVCLAAPDAVAMIHCGWRGLAAGILERGVAALEAGSAHPRQDFAAVIGPGIGPCCYEVSGDVIAALAKREHPRDARPDLAAIVRTELSRAGIPESRVVGCQICTACNPELFYSHRRDGSRSGRQAGLAWLGS